MADTFTVEDPATGKVWDQFTELAGAVAYLFGVREERELHGLPLTLIIKKNGERVL